PPPVQDTKAAQLIIHALSPSEDVSRIPVIWYIGHVPPPGSGEWDRVPAPYAGNTISPRAYQARWLSVHDQKFAAYQASRGGGSRPPTGAGGSPPQMRTAMPRRQTRPTGVSSTADPNQVRRRRLGPEPTSDTGRTCELQTRPGGGLFTRSDSPRRRGGPTSR